MSAKIEMLPPAERVQILAGRLEKLRGGAGDYRPSNRAMAIKECARKLAEASADLKKVAH